MIWIKIYLWGEKVEVLADNKYCLYNAWMMQS